MLPFYVFLMVVAVGVFLYVNRQPKLEPECPNCGSKDCKEIDVEQVNMGYYERPSGSFGGTEVMIKADEQHTFHCNQCASRFKKTITRSR